MRNRSRPYEYGLVLSQLDVATFQIRGLRHICQVVRVFVANSFSISYLPCTQLVAEVHIRVVLCSFCFEQKYAILGIDLEYVIVHGAVFFDYNGNMFMFIFVIVVDVLYVDWLNGCVTTFLILFHQVDMVHFLFRSNLDLVVESVYIFSTALFVRPSPGQLKLVLLCRSK